jgi:hypothetical protein
MFLTLLLVIAKKVERTKCPPTDEWKMKMWYIVHTMECCQTITNNKILIYATPKMNLEKVTLRERS